MRYRMLGSLQIVENDVPSRISAHKVELLLATLLIRANQAVGRDQIMYELWGEHPPRRAAAGLHVYVSQLRKLLGQGSADLSPLVTCSPGYLLHVADDELDLYRFQDLAQRGRQAAREGRHEEACGLFGSALRLWRGPALTELRDGPIVSRFVTWLEELRLDCIEVYVESHFALGRHRELLGMLYTLISEHPLHEAAYRQLMIALYRCRRRADALAVYQQARDTITRELGLEPCPELRRLHVSILQADDRLDLHAGV